MVMVVNGGCGGRQRWRSTVVEVVGMEMVVVEGRGGGCWW